jgi:hypothetical protein
LRAVNQESQQSRACGVLYLVAGTNGKNLNRQDAKFAKLDRWLDKKEEDGKSCQSRPHKSSLAPSLPYFATSFAEASSYANATADKTADKKATANTSTPSAGSTKVKTLRAETNPACFPT